LFVSTSVINLSSKPIFKLGYVLCLVTNFMKFVLSKFSASLFALNYLFMLAKTSFIIFSR
jgi:hypothetical protein